MKKQGLVFICCLGLGACVVGPNYKLPAPETATYQKIPNGYKEAPKGLKYAKPRDSCDRKAWWHVFHDKTLNQLESELEKGNQSIVMSEAQYQQAKALVDQARSNYFPTIATSISLTRANQILFGSAGQGTTVGTGGSTVNAGAAAPGGATSGPFTAEFLLLTASWEPDIWGGVRRLVEANEAGAKASEAQLALTKLSAQASLAQYYFELRTLDRAQKSLDQTASDLKKIYSLTEKRYRSGTASEVDRLKAKSQWESAEAQAIQNGILRGQYEHAMATLLGKPPALFALAKNSSPVFMPTIPISLPSSLLERRPDIAQAERLMAQANAQIGVAISTYFPALTLSASGSIQGRGALNSIMDNPALGWSLGPQLTSTLYDGGMRSATVDAARANYEMTVANYKKTVLSAFQEVEDNLLSIQQLRSQEKMLKAAEQDARQAYQLAFLQYQSGTIDYQSVLTARNSLALAEKNASDIAGLLSTSSVGLIKALGGAWTDEGLHDRSIVVPIISQA